MKGLEDRKYKVKWNVPAATSLSSVTREGSLDNSSSTALIVNSRILREEKKTEIDREEKIVKERENRNIDGEEIINNEGEEIMTKCNNEGEEIIKDKGEGEGMEILVDENLCHCNSNS